MAVLLFSYHLTTIARTTINTTMLMAPTAITVTEKNNMHLLTTFIHLSYLLLHV